MRVSGLCALCWVAIAAAAARGGEGPGATDAPRAPQSRAESPVSPRSALRDLEGSFRLIVPGLNGRELVFEPGSDLSACTPDKGALVFSARLGSPSRSPVRLVFHVQNRQGCFYQTASAWAIPHDHWREIRIDFSPRSASWEACGHARPWDAQSARAISRLGFRLFSELPYEGELHVQGLRWEPFGGRVASCAEIVDLVEAVPEGRSAGKTWELRFRVRPEPADPFDPARCDFWCEVLSPEGERIRREAFFYQEYQRSPATGELVAVGEPDWHVRWRPTAEGRYRWRLFLSGEEPAAEGWFVVSGAAPAPTPAFYGDLPSSFDEFVLELGPGRSWRPELAKRRASWRDGAFARDNLPVPASVWRPVLEWTSKWGRWEGLGRYDLELAWRFDRVLEEAERRGISMPFALLDDESFLDSSTYRWGVSPLSKAEGGMLAGPGEFFTSDAARTYFLRRARYAIARWGSSAAISEWAIASGLPAAGVAEWHARVGNALAPLCQAGALPAPEGVRPEESSVGAARGALISLHPFAVPFREERELGEFEEPRPSGWKLDLTDSPGAWIGRARGAGLGGGDALEVAFPQAESPGWVTITRPLDDDLFEYDCLSFDVKMPEDASGVGRAQVVVRDRDLLWYECLVDSPLRAGDWTRCIVDLSTDGSRLRPVGHARPWSGYARSRVRQLAIRIFPNGRVAGKALVDHVRLYAGAREEPRPLDIAVKKSPPETVGRFEKYELVLDVRPEFPNPFDPDVVAVDAIIKGPGERAEFVVPGFFYEPYSRRLERAEVLEEQGRRQVRVVREVEVLDVAGEPDWRVRFAPDTEGVYTVTLRVRARGAELLRPGPSFRCVPSHAKGYVRVSADGRYFEHSTGEVFYAIGPVIRSPNDARDLDRDPSIREKVLESGWRGTYQFDDYFQALARCGANWIRMWACSWWCGLEWYHRWPGYGGTGVYNMQNAWRLDHVVESAERAGVYIQLCLQNHGQASEMVDHEWEYNPYNRYLPEAFAGKDEKEGRVQLLPQARSDERMLRPGGWLESPAELFSDGRARKAKRNLLRYFVARWGYSTHILAWALSSEVEFTGEYQRVQYGHDDNDLNSGRWPEGEDRARATLEWHRDMARYLAGLDGSRHMVTTHFSHPHRGRAIWGLGELSYAQSNAYTAFAQFRWFTGPPGPNNCIPAPMAIRQYWERYLGRYGKPVLLGEWGGHWMRNPIPLLDAELHTGSWASIMTPMAGATGFWWWSHVHFRDRYGVYAAVRRFLEGEDRRGLGLRQMDWRLEPSSGGLDALVLGNDRRADVYIYHVRHAFELGSAPPVGGVTLVVPGLREGRYVVEVWDTTDGHIADRAAALSGPRGFEFELPVIRGDVALKVRPLE